MVNCRKLNPIGKKGDSTTFAGLTGGDWSKFFLKEKKSFISKYSHFSP